MPEDTTGSVPNLELIWVKSLRLQRKRRNTQTYLDFPAGSRAAGRARRQVISPFG